MAKLDRYDGATTAVLATAFLSLLVWLPVVLLGFNKKPANAPDDYRIYFEQTNLWPYPFFLVVLAPAVWLTWKPMLRAWTHLAETGVLQGPKGRPEKEAVQSVLLALRQKRWVAVVMALAVAMFVNVVDWWPRYNVFIGTATFDQQREYACTHPDASVKWIFTGDIKVICPGKQGSPPSSENRAGIALPTVELSIILIWALQQFLIVFFSALGVTQILLHTYLFARFERLNVARTFDLRLRLACQSPLDEFGLERWNHALNNFYWSASLAMLGVFMSRAATTPENWQPGQQMLGIAVPACLITPMVATVLVRQARLPAAWTEIEPNGLVKSEDFRRQQLWPLERNWSSKIGILLAFALAAISLGFEFSKLMQLAG